MNNLEPVNCDHIVGIVNEKEARCSERPTMKSIDYPYSYCPDCKKVITFGDVVGLSNRAGLEGLNDNLEAILKFFKN